jgi:hypothetical protein
MRRLLYAIVVCLICLVAREAAAASRLAVLVANNAGAKDEVELRYAEEDAAKFHRVLRELGDFRPEDMMLLRGEDSDAARRAIIRMNERLRSEPSEGSMLVVYYSGHADATALHLGQSRFAIDELEALVRGSAAQTRVLVVDACRSGTLTRVKGAVAAPQVDIRVRRADASEGAVFLTSSAANEDAQESDAIRGSFFTHYLVSGLRGAADADADGRVTLAEAYGYAYRATLRASSTSLGGLQHPTFAYELRGREDIVLTVLSSAAGRAGGTLTLPAQRTFLVIQNGPEGAVLAELAADAPNRRLALPAGRYFVRGRGPDNLVEGEVSLGASENRVVEEGELAKVAYARLVRKGGTDVRRALGVQAGYTVRTGLWSGSSPCHGAFAGFELDTPGLSWTARVSACRGGFANDTLRAHADELNAQIEGAHVWDLPAISVQIGLALGASALYETFTTRGEAPSRTALAATLTTTAGVEVPLAGAVALQVGAHANVHAFKQSDGAPVAAWATPVTFGSRAGVVARFW